MHGVKTLSESDVKHLKRRYNDAVLGPQRNIAKAIEDLKEHRHTIHAQRNNLWVVAMEPHAKEDLKNQAKLNFAGLMGGHHLHHDEESQEQLQEEHHDEEEPAVVQASFKELSRMTGMEVDHIEDVFRVWMRHSDKTETILRKKFPNLLEDLCPKRTIAENDLNAWWDQIQNKSYAECLAVDWTRADDRYNGWRKASLGTEGQRTLAQARKTPATFDQFVIWWSTSEVRHT